MGDWENSQWQKLLDLIDEADSVQQSLVVDNVISYDFHNRLQRLAEDVEEYVDQNTD